MNEQQLLAHPAVVEALADAEARGYSRGLLVGEPSTALAEQLKQTRRVLWALVYDLPDHRARITESTVALVRTGVELTLSEGFDVARGDIIAHAHDPR